MPKWRDYTNPSPDVRLKLAEDEAWFDLRGGELRAEAIRFFDGLERGQKVLTDRVRSWLAERGIDV